MVQAWRLGLSRPRFKSGQPHQEDFLSADSKLFLLKIVENCVIGRFKCFSKVFERLKPNSLVFEISSLSMYRTTFSFFDILHSHPSGCEGKFDVVNLVIDLRKVDAKDN